MEEKISDFIRDANKEYFLPSIQREFVWTEEKIKNLFDSIIQGYPIGNIIIWDCEKELGEKLKLEVYEFLEEYNEQDPHNKEANLNNKTKIKLVLDGQQRLTSLFIGLVGKYIIQSYKKTKEKRLYVNLFSDIETKPDNIYDLKYELNFLEKEEVEQKNSIISPNCFWVELGKVLDFSGKTAEDYKDFYEKEIVSRAKEDKDLIKQARSILGQIHLAICDKAVLLIQKVPFKEEEKVLNVFVRTNEGGVKLEKADLLLSYMESNKEFFKPDHARKEIIKFVDSLNKERFEKPEYSFSKDDILKAALVLSDLEVRYKLENFKKENLEVINSNWGDIKKYLSLTVSLLAKNGFNKKSILSKNALIPIAYYLKKLNKGEAFVDSTSSEDIKLQGEIITWLVKSYLLGTFGGSSDTILTNIRDRLQKGQKLGDILYGKVISKENIINLMDSSEYESKHSHLFLILACGLPRGNKIHQDHIYPQSLLDKGNYQGKYKNSIYNLQLLDASVNTSKRDEDPLKWLSKQSDFYKTRMFIPAIPLSITSFEEFIKQRKEMLLEKICSELKIVN